MAQVAAAAAVISLFLCLCVCVRVLHDWNACGTIPQTMTNTENTLANRAEHCEVYEALCPYIFAAAHTYLLATVEVKSRCWIQKIDDTMTPSVRRKRYKHATLRASGTCKPGLPKGLYLGITASRLCAQEYICPSRF